jgi:hypothetical protein
LRATALTLKYEDHIFKGFFLDRSLKFCLFDCIGPTSET